ncbi:MAG: S8 family serine peptidase [Acidobacteriota bacterium]
MLRPLVLPLVVAAAVVSLATSSVASELGPRAIAQISALAAEKTARTPTEQKIASALLLELKRRQGDARLAALSDLRLASGIEADGRVLVDLDWTGSDADALRRQVEARSGRLVSAFPRFDAARVHLPLERVPSLAALSAVRTVRPADRWFTQVTTEGDVAHGADAVRATRGVDGTGVAVGAMSDSVDALADLQALGELPNDVIVLPGQDGNPGTSEGTALLEIVHDLAPGADLLFATGRGGQAQMAQNILDLQAAGCDIIVDDVLYFSEPVFQDGIIAQAVDTVAAAGTIYYSSAGNSGNLNDDTSGVFEGDYVATALPAPLAGLGLSAHDFGGGTNATTLDVDTPFFITLQWANPQDAASDDYDLYLLDSTLSNVLAASTTTQDGTQDPFEILDSTASDDAGNKLVVVQFGGDARFLHLNTHRGEIEHGTDGQIFGHPAARGALAVAAVNVGVAGGGQFVGGPGVQVEPFSSDGPRRIFFNPDGSPVQTLGGLPAGVKGGPISEVRQKPDVTAADGVTTATPGFDPFFGTSASAPHAAGISALFEELFPSVPVPAAFDIFKSTALDIETSGFDRDSGNGIQMADPPFDTTIFADGFESGDATSWTESN